MHFRTPFPLAQNSIHSVKPAEIKHSLCSGADTALPYKGTSSPREETDLQMHGMIKPTTEGTPEGGQEDPDGDF